MAPKIAVIYYSVYGHVRQMALSAQKGIASAGGKSDLFQVQETLSPEILKAIKAPPKADDPIISPNQLADYDGFMLGIPTRYGSMPAQWRTFWDSTGALWAKAALQGKYVTCFVSTGTPGGGQEMTPVSSMSTFAHHGLIYVPLGYKNAGKFLTNLDEVHGGSPWGAGTLAAGDGSRKPTANELGQAEAQGKQFWETLARVNFRD